MRYYSLQVDAMGVGQNVKKRFFMDKILLIIGGGSFLGLFVLLSILAITSGMVFQGALMGLIGIAFGAVCLVLLADA